MRCTRIISDDGEENNQHSNLLHEPQVTKIQCNVCDMIKSRYYGFRGIVDSVREIGLR